VNVHEHAKLTPAGRGELVRRVLFENQTVEEVGRAMGVSERTVRKWVERYQSGGVSGLADRSSRPKRSPRTFPRKVVERIERLRHRKTRAYGSRRS
jgi:transposase-like protein